MKIDIYKLGEYKIIESDTGELRWEAHFGFATLQEGRCFRKGTILFIGPAENDRVGFLKGDFLDHIKQFSKWSKTKYCCRSLEIYHCRTYRRVTKQQMLLWMLDRAIDEGDRLYSEESDQRSDNISTRGARRDVAFSDRSFPGPAAAGVAISAINHNLSRCCDMSSKAQCFYALKESAQNNRDRRIGERAIIRCQGVSLRDVVLILNMDHKLRYDVLGKEQRAIVIHSRMHHPTFSSS